MCFRKKEIKMSNTNFDHLLTKAKSCETQLNELIEIAKIGDEILCVAVAENTNCNWELLNFLRTLNIEEVNRTLSARYTVYPDLYSLSVREIEISDASYVLGLRLDATYSKFISKVSDDLNAQKTYIQNYITNNASCRDSFYFILTNAVTGKRCGTVRIYNLNNGTFEWGSWILDENKTRYAAMETAILIYEFAFKALGFDQSEFEVNRANERVIQYHIKSGAEVIRVDDVNFYFRIDKETALTFAKSLRDKLET